MSDRELTEDEIIARYKENEYIEERTRPVREDPTEASRADLDRRTVELLEQVGNFCCTHPPGLKCRACEARALLTEWREVRRG